ncbi:MAG TPA: carbonic anhydrase [Kofleriaceae bacterium]|jgi:carbonic anhydrase|nr:carbonic anhydrase [Kofleriaceae bacterium]
MTRIRRETAAPDALRRLQEGNERYSKNLRSVDSMMSHNRLDLLETPQRPVAIIVGCSDARAPAETVFDQGLGDLFVIRVAGNIVAPSQIGSVEFAAERFGTRLVVVMGHTRCGAIDAAIEAIRGESDAGSRNLASIVDRVRPAIDSVVRGSTADLDTIRRAALRANVVASVTGLRNGSDIIHRLASEDGLVIVGADLDLTTGVVDFFHGV